MKTPPLLLGASLIFWGWQTDLLLVSGLMAMAIEGSRLLKFRWDFSSSDFSRISDLCTLLLIGTFAYLLFSRQAIQNIFLIFQWLPLFFLPLILSEFYSTDETIDIRALSVILRKRQTEDQQPKTEHKGPIPLFLDRFPLRMSVSYPYGILCILSAGAGNRRTIEFYLGLLVLWAWASWRIRSHRFGNNLWIGLFILGSIGGYAGQAGLHELQQYIEKKGLEWFVNLERRDADPYQTMTAIGSVMELKPSNRILFRIKTAPPGSHSILLREATYNVYRFSTWFASDARFTVLQSEPDSLTWKIRESSSDPNQNALKYQEVTVYSYLEWGKGILKLPLGAFQIENLPVLTTEINPLGTVKVDGGPGLVAYRVKFDEHNMSDRPPDDADRQIPDVELPAVSQIVNELGLTSQSPENAVTALEDFFENRFVYSLRPHKLEAKKQDMTPLTNFLLYSRAGHCEYFATATVLMLRYAGIPARYVTGYAVHEFAPDGRNAVVRERDAHAWVLAYLHGAWQNVDTTPSVWMDMEANAAPSWQFISDFWAWIVFKYSQWRWTDQHRNVLKPVGWILAVILLFRFRSLLARKRMKQHGIRSASLEVSFPKPGSDSAFYQIEQRLTELGWMRHPSETLSAWIRRIEAASPPVLSSQALKSLLAITARHYRYRFDPIGISNQELSLLSTEVQAWLKNPLPFERK